MNLWIKQKNRPLSLHHTRYTASVIVIAPFFVGALNTFDSVVFTIDSPLKESSFEA